MIRRQARQRRDYLYRRALTLREAETAQRRAQLRDALATGKPLTGALARDASLRADYKYDESADVAPSGDGGDNNNNNGKGGNAAAASASLEDRLALDDEYAGLSGLRDPRVLVTTSRSPSARLSAFAKEIRLLMPTAIRLNRGSLVLPTLVEASKAAGLSDVVLLHEHRGVPSALTISHLPHGPTASFSLHNVVLRHDLPAPARGTVSESYPHLVFDGLTTPLGKRVASVLKHLFPPRDPVGPDVPGGGKLGSRVVTFANRDDCIEVRHHVFVRTGYQAVELAEVGPRMTLRLFEIRAGTLEAKDADVEWHLNQYTRTSRKKNYL